MSYFLCEIIPYENEVVQEYDTLEELIEDVKLLKISKDRYYIIKGEVI